MVWRFNLRQMEVFRAVMLTGSTIQAGRTLNISQPAVSRALADLEAQLGSPLFLRRGGRLIATPKAEWLFEVSQETLARVDHLDAILRDIDQIPERPIRVVGNSAMAHSILPDALMLFRQLHPTLDIVTDVVTRRDNRRWLNEQEFDLAATMLPIEYPSDMIEVLPLTQGVCILPRGHRLCAEPAIDLHMLDNEPLVALQNHNLTRYKMEQAFISRGLRLRVAVGAETISTLVMLVAAGLGCAIVDPFSAIKFERLGLVRRPLLTRIELSYGIVHPLREQSLPEVDDFAQCVRQVYRNVLQIIARDATELADPCGSQSEIL